MHDKLEAISNRFYDLEEQMSDPKVVNDTARFSKVHKEYKDLQPIAVSYTHLDVYKRQSNEFSTNSLTTDSGRCTTSPAAI